MLAAEEEELRKFSAVQIDESQARLLGLSNMASVQAQRKVREPLGAIDFVAQAKQRRDVASEPASPVKDEPEEEEREANHVEGILVEKGHTH